jgi:hypothetical protein
MKTVLLIRDFRSFTGGHLKIFHYMQHILNSGFAQPKVLLTPNSRRDASNPFLAYPDLIVDEPVPHDLLFLGGRDSTSGTGTVDAIFDTVRVLNANQALKANGPQSVVIITNCTIGGNNTGVIQQNGATILTSGNNTIQGNGTDVSGTLTAAALQ